MKRKFEHKVSKKLDEKYNMNLKMKKSSQPPKDEYVIKSAMLQNGVVEKCATRGIELCFGALNIFIERFTKKFKLVRLGI